MNNIRERFVIFRVMVKKTHGNSLEERYCSLNIGKESVGFTRRQFIQKKRDKVYQIPLFSEPYSKFKCIEIGGQCYI